MKRKYLTIAALAAIVAGCSSDEMLTPQVDNLNDTPITVTAGVEGMKTRAGYETPENGTAVLPATFYLTVTQEADVENSQYNYTDVLMTKGENNAYTPVSSLLWKDAEQNPFVSAYTTEGESFTVQTDQSTTEGVLASDLLGAVSTTEGDVTITNNNIAVNFRHLLCKLDVTYSWGTEFQDVISKSIKSVEYQGFGTNVTLNRTNCTVAEPYPLSTTGDITAYVDGTTSEAIFAPRMDITPKIVITATINNTDRTFALNVTVPTEGFVSGKCYTMNVAIGGTSVEGESVTATVANGWVNAITGNMATN